MNEVVGGKGRAGVAGGLDGTGREKGGRLGPENEQAGNRGPVPPLFVSGRDAGVAEQIKPGDGRRAAKEGFEAVLVEVGDGRGEHGLFVEDVLTASLLEESGEFRGREVALRGTDPLVIAPARRAVHVEAAGNFRQEQVFVLSIVTGKHLLADDRPNRRFAVVRSDVENPVLDGIDLRGRNPLHNARVIDAEQHDAPLRVGERNQFAGQVFGVRRRHAPRPEADLLELGASIFSGPELVQYLFSTVEHDVTWRDWVGGGIGVLRRSHRPR